MPSGNHEPKHCSRHTNSSPGVRAHRYSQRSDHKGTQQDTQRDRELPDNQNMNKRAVTTPSWSPTAPHARAERQRLAEKTF